MEPSGGESCELQLSNWHSRLHKGRVKPMQSQISDFKSRLVLRTLRPLIGTGRGVLVLVGRVRLELAEARRQVFWLDLCGLSVLSPDGVIDFFTVDADFLGGR